MSYDRPMPAGGLWNLPLARKDDPPTSKMAAVKIAPKLTMTRQRVLTDIINNPGTTAGEIDVRLKSPSAHKRVSDLHAMGLIREDATRICQTSGHRARTWTAMRISDAKS